MTTIPTGETVRNGIAGEFHPPVRGLKLVLILLDMKEKLLYH